MTKLVFCLECGECLGEDRIYVAKDHLKKFPNHTRFLTKTMVDPFILDNIDVWITRKMRSTDSLQVNESTSEWTEPQNNNIIKY